MKLSSTVLIAASILAAYPAHAATKIQVSKGKLSSPTSKIAETRSSDTLAANESSSTTLNNQTVKRSPSGTYKFITDGGNPSPGTLLISPMVGQYALTGFEAGLKVSLQVAKHAFIHALNNSVSVEAEVFQGTWNGFFGQSKSLFFGGGGRWDFHLAPKWTAYGTAGLQIEQKQTIADYEVNERELNPNLQIGGMLIMNENFRFRAEYDYSHGSYRFGLVCAL